MNGGAGMDRPDCDAVLCLPTPRGYVMSPPSPRPCVPAPPAQPPLPRFFTPAPTLITSPLQGAAYQTGDWLDYLPPEAGGRAASRPGSAAGAARPAPAAASQPAAQGQLTQQQQQLGRILYVRDSGSELDSDEDPDDDLDI